MARLQQKPPKAYKDMEFLNSPDARLVRMLAEFLGPQRRFRQHQIRDTIVFFGSARVLPKREALKQYRDLRKKASTANRAPRGLTEAMQRAAVSVDMSRYYEDTVELARRLTLWSKSLSMQRRFVVCSGGGPGIMEAANRGAALARGKSIGLNISLPFEQFANPYITPELSMEFHYFFMRKFWFAYLAKGLVIMPGGFGTLDELMEMLTLHQTRKVTKPMAVVMYGKEYWRNTLDFDYMIARGVISKKDLGLFHVSDSVDEAFAYLKEFLTRAYVKE
ncbi:MAG: TIGR00730 family Rossman fold protein [Bacteroidetes bacterium]|nr:TIGR00730 family Rossman fold protein [Bacteroidota bacterium]